MAYSEVKAEFKHTKIVFDERGMRLVRNDGKALPTAPTAEQAQRAREAIAAAIICLQGDDPGNLSAETLWFWMKKAEEDVKQAFAALETD